MSEKCDPIYSMMDIFFRAVTVPNTDLWSRINQAPLWSEILKRKWCWLGHVLRRDPDTITRNTIDWNPQGSRPALT